MALFSLAVKYHLWNQVFQEKLRANKGIRLFTVLASIDLIGIISGITLITAIHYIFLTTDGTRVPARSIAWGCLVIFFWSSLVYTIDFIGNTKHLIKNIGLKRINTALASVYWKFIPSGNQGESQTKYDYYLYHTEMNLSDLAELNENYKHQYQLRESAKELVDVLLNNSEMSELYKRNEFGANGVNGNSRIDDKHVEHTRNYLLLVTYIQSVLTDDYYLLYPIARIYPDQVGALREDRSRWSQLLTHPNNRGAIQSELDRTRNMEFEVSPNNELLDFLKNVIEELKSGRPRQPGRQKKTEQALLKCAEFEIRAIKSAFYFTPSMRFIQNHTKVYRYKILIGYFMLAILYMVATSMHLQYLSVTAPKYSTIEILLSTAETIMSGAVLDIFEHFEIDIAEKELRNVDVIQRTMSFVLRSLSSMTSLTILYWLFFFKRIEY